jgi:hypothetical protein
VSEHIAKAAAEEWLMKRLSGHQKLELHKASAKATP